MRGLLRPRSRPRNARQHGRSGRRHRGAVDRRAGHPAHHAHLPHRRRGADFGAVLHRIQLRRNDPDQEPQHLAQLRRRSHLHDAQHGCHRGGSGRHRARRPPHPVRRPHEGRRGRSRQARPAHRRVGSLHPPDAHRGRRLDRVRGPGRGTVDVGIARRIDRHRQARGHRLAHRRRPRSAGSASVHRHQGQGRQDPQARPAAARRAICWRSTPFSRSTPAAT